MAEAGRNGAAKLPRSDSLESHGLRGEQRDRCYKFEMRYAMGVIATKAAAIKVGLQQYNQPHRAAGTGFNYPFRGEPSAQCERCRA